MEHPRVLDFGKVSVIFKEICNEIENNGFHIECQMGDNGKIKTWQTVQVYMKEEDHFRIYGQLNHKRLAIGAVQYEGSNDYSVKPPHTVNWRFYRDNLPDKWKERLEQIDNDFRKDKNSGPPINPKATSIAFKFIENDERSKQFILQLSNILASLLQAD
ncbi:hypothetical protein EDM56_02175 [Brevibacillus fluminis]|uniref:Uncharacterized protein n=1 Tax=Brevibacillus fluminis TaxID=511487 RepID=A0A3M8DWG1_9BACL|nr:hypothetical protein [Brevibacillus fluminis]RNB92523.1 hypothetical protein EDM56_02175 [Brevibacillus fluminis]